MSTFGVINRYRGGTADQYDRTVAVVHPEGGLPAGQTFHAAGPTEDGWVVVAIWDARESFERFRDEVLLPALSQVEDGLPAPPDTTTFQIHNWRTG
jgi:hypothetical protein